MLIECSECRCTNRVPTRRLKESPRCGRCKAPLPSVDKPISIGSAGEFHELVDGSPLPVVVDFWAPWCGPCRVVAPEVEKLAHDRSGSVLVAKVNTDLLPELGAEHRVSGIPTLVCFRGGRESRRVSGAMPASAIARALAL